ncbi:MAG: hypothetical protein ACRD33_09935, partial [Candidatus Acidiferrales bacterium]
MPTNCAAAGHLRSDSAASAQQSHEKCAATAEPLRDKYGTIAGQSFANRLEFSPLRTRQPGRPQV